MHFRFKARLVNAQTVFAGNQGRQIHRKTVRVIEFKDHAAADFLPVGNRGSRFPFGNDLIQAAQAVFQRPQKRVFLLANHFCHKLLLRFQFRENILELVGQHGHQPAHERLPETQIRVAVAHRPPQNPADDVAGFGVGGQLSVGNGETHGADMVGNDAHGNVNRLVLAVGLASHLPQLLDQRLENIGVVIGLLALYRHAEAFKTHARIHVFFRQLHQTSVGAAFKLHEHVVPDFHHQRVVVVHAFAAGHAPPFLVRTQVNVDFGTWAARAGIAHLPEIVLFAAEQNPVFGQEPFPDFQCFVIRLKVFGFIATENGGVQAVFGQLVHFGQQFPAPFQRIFLEIIAEAPVAQHFKHGVVVGVVAHIFQVVVLARYAEALLRVGDAARRRCLVAQEIILELRHARVGEHQRRVVFEYQRCGGHNPVGFGTEKI